MEERIQTLSDIRVALPVLAQIDNICDDIVNLDQQNMALQTGLASHRHNHSRLCASLAAFGAYVVLAYALHFIGKLIAIRGAAAFVFMLGILVAIFVVYTKVKSNILASTKGDEIIETNNGTIENMSQHIYRIVEENQNYIDVLPRDYRYFSAASFFEKVLANGQADSIKEAISLYEEHLHRQRIENMNVQRIFIEEQQARMLANIEHNSASAANSAGTAAVFSALHYLK